MTAAPFRYRQLAWLVSAALGAGSAAAAPAGNVDFTIGGVSVTGADGRARAAAKGQELQSGDRIVTTDGRAQIRFTDGAYVSLQPNTDFAIRDYRYDGKTDGTEKGVFGLVRGALRTVTGAIGRVNRGAYQIQTPTATIGIRGTGGLIQVQEDGTTRVRGFSGIWTLTNAGGSLSVGERQAAVATPNTKEPPTETTEGPLVPAPPPGPLEVALLPRPYDNALPPATGTNSFVAGDVVVPSGPFAGTPASTAESVEKLAAQAAQPPVTPPVTPPVPPLSCAAPGCELSYATLISNVSVPPFIPSVQNIAAPNSNVMLNAGFAMVGFTDPMGQPAAVVTQIETGTADNVVSWGRWTAATLAGSPWPNFNTLAYATGLPSPIADLTATTGTFTFNFIGGTNPTDGTNVGTVLGGQVIGQFGPTPMVGINNFMYQIRGSTFTLSTPVGSELVVPAGGPFAPFTGAVSVTTPGTECSGPCSATVNGHFLGTGATHAGFAYNVSTVNGTVNTVGAAAFKR